ncbi:MAG: c-type cytochrome [Gemmataceae bacterium]
MSSTLLLALAVIPTAPSPATDISVPPGFTAAVVADNAIAPDIYTMTIDDKGRVLVAGRGYVRVLVDENNDGVAERAIDLIDGLKDGPMGLFAEGDSLYVVTDGGLQRYRGYNGKDKLTRHDTIVKLKTVGEHEAHAVRRGPDGWLYVLCGNNTGVTKDTITSRLSPVKDPVAGVLLRISPDSRTFWGTERPHQIEVVADGFRNAYSFDFNLDGEPFTYDSDNERCVGLPWYEPCRFYHVVPGGNYGWRSPQLGQFWRKPPYFVDCVPPICYLGRGSPTGVACYGSTQFPAQYRGGFFLADWTFGRIHFVPLKPKESTYEGRPEVFAEAIGTSGFAPTAIAVHPKSGELFVSIGGRGTRGGVYRIRHDKGGDAKPLPMAKRSLEWTDADTKRWLADCLSDDARVRRTTLELMARIDLRIFPWTPKLKDAVKPNLSHADPLVRAAAARLLKPLIVPLGGELDTQAALTIALAQADEDPNAALGTALAVLRKKDATEDQKLQALRIIQLAFGDLTAKDAKGTAFEGYTLKREPTRRQREEIGIACYQLFPNNNSNLEAEAFRTIACVQAEAHVGRVLQRITSATDVRSDLAYLAILGRLETVRDSATATDIADVLLSLEQKAIKQKVSRDTFWPLRLAEIVTALQPRYPKLASEMLEHRKFGQPEHLLFAKALDLPQRETLDRFIMTAEKSRLEYAWTPSQIALFAHLGPRFRRHQIESLKLWERPELRDAILKVLPPEKGDEAKFISGLESLDPSVIRVSAAALLELGVTSELSAHIIYGVKALRRLAPEDKAARDAVIKLLEKSVKDVVEPTPKAWTEWLTKRYPNAAKQFATNDGFDVVAWKKREANIEWDKGDAERGKAVFTKATCAACHDGGRALGPSLLGISKRFGRDDLLTAILQPSKDVSPRYRAIRITTNDDKVYIGMLIYEATDGVILQTNADTSVRIAGDNIAAKRPVESSLMPAGLLDKLTEVEIADLLAYLKTLEEPKK